METQVSHECENIAHAITTNFEKCNITLLEMKTLKQIHVDQETIKRGLEKIKTQSRSKH